MNNICVKPNRATYQRVKNKTIEDLFISAKPHQSKQFFSDILLIARQIRATCPLFLINLFLSDNLTSHVRLEVFLRYYRHRNRHLAGRLAITMLRARAIPRALSAPIAPGSRRTAVRPYICPSVCIFNHPFIRPHVHAPILLTMRAGPLGPSDRTRSRRVVSCPRGGWPNQRGRCTRAPGSAFTPPPSSSLSLYFFWSASRARARVRARERSQTYPPVNVLLPLSRCVTAALPPFSLSSLPSSSFSYYYSLSSILPPLTLPRPSLSPSLHPPASWSSSLLSYVLSISLKPRLCSRVQKKL